MTREDFAWAAGVFEGEGCFYQSANRHQTCAVMRMTDEDIIRRFHAIMGVGHVAAIAPRQPHHKPFWEWRTSSFQGVQHTVASLWPWLGLRRKAKAHAMMVRVRDKT